MVFGQKMKISFSAKHDIIGKGISRGAEWRKFQFHSTFHCGVMSTKYDHNYVYRCSNDYNSSVCLVVCRSLSFVYPYGSTLTVVKPAVAVLSSGSTSYPVNRPIGAFCRSKVGWGGCH